MKQFLASIYLILCIINLVYNVFFEKFANGFETIVTIGITAIGIWLSWTVMTAPLQKK